MINEIIYPNVLDTGSMFRTVLRKEKDGIWYDWHVIEHYTQDSKETALAKVHRNVYFSLVLGEISPDLMASSGRYPVFPKSVSQISEADRLKEQIIK